MLRLIKAELFKLFKNRTFRVLCVVSVLLSILMLLMASPVMEKVMRDSLEGIPPEQREVILKQMAASSSSEELVKGGQLGFRLVAKDAMNPTALEVYHASFGAGAVEILIGILIGAFLAKEYSEGTIKNTLAYGRSRAEFYMAKFVALVVGIIVMLLTLTLVSTIGTAIMNGWGDSFSTGQVVGMIGTFISAVIANTAVASIIMIIAIMIKGNGGTIGVTVALFILAPTILSFVYGIYEWFDKVYELTPFYNSALATSINASRGDLVRSFIIGLVTITISLFVGLQLFKKQDIK